MVRDVRPARPADDILTAAHEVLRPALRVERDDVVREQPVVHRAPHRLGQHRPVGRPGDVHEVGEPRVRSRGTDECRREIEVVVVKEDGRVRVVVERADDRIGERSVDAFVALVPGSVKRTAELRPRRLGPEPVLDEPQHRIGDDVVVAVVHLRLVRDEHNLPARRLTRNDSILVGRRTRDPDHMSLLPHPAQRRREAAAAAALHAPSVDPVVGHRPTVRDDDQC